MYSVLFLLCSAVVVTSVRGANSTKRILVAGDSWGTDIAGGTVLGLSAFDRKLNEYKCDFKATNIAIAGSTAAQWSSGLYLTALKTEIKSHDIVWITLMGNDALAELPSCADAGNTSEVCGDLLVQKMTDTMGTILDAVHEANADARVVGFGYDVMFGGLGCETVAKGLFPQCWSTEGNGNDADSIACFNTQFVRIQRVWEDLESTRDFVDVINVLGTTQLAGGDDGVVVGKPDITKFGPAKYWPDYLACIHPSLSTSDSCGAMLIMEQFYQQYWAKTLGC